MPTKQVKLARFEKLAVKRVNETIERIRLIGKLANKKNYSYTAEHAKEIVEELEKEIKTLRQKFEGTFPNPAYQFEFKKPRKASKKGRRKTERPLS